MDSSGCYVLQVNSVLFWYYCYTVLCCGCFWQTLSIWRTAQRTLHRLHVVRRCKFTFACMHLVCERAANSRRERQKKRGRNTDGIVGNLHWRSAGKLASGRTAIIVGERKEARRRQRKSRSGGSAGGFERAGGGEGNSREFQRANGDIQLAFKYLRATPDLIWFAARKIGTLLSRQRERTE